MSVNKEICYHNAISLAPKFSSALKKLHRIDELEPIFCGGEDIIFLYELMLHIKDGKKFEQKIILETFSNFLNISGRTATTSTFKMQFFQFFGLLKFYQLMAFVKQHLKLFLSDPKTKPGWKFFLQKNIIHFSGHRRDDIFVSPNFSRSIPKPKLKFNYQMRKSFENLLLELGVSENIAEALTLFTPASHVENFKYYYKRAFEFDYVKNVCANIYGIMEDPFLGFVVCISRANLIYIQHGGYYGFVNDPIHCIEQNSCNKMYFWGVGENNCFPTKFPVGLEPKKTKDIYIILSAHASEIEIKNKIKLREILKSNLKLSVKLVCHPTSKHQIRHSHIKLGISFDEVRSAALILFDDHFHSLIYTRIMAGGLFLILDSERNYGSAIFPKGQIFQKLLDGLTFSELSIVNEISQIMIGEGKKYIAAVDKLQDLVLCGPKIQDIYNVDIE